MLERRGNCFGLPLNLGFFISNGRLKIERIGVPGGHGMKRNCIFTRCRATYYFYGILHDLERRKFWCRESTVKGCFDNFLSILARAAVVIIFKLAVVIDREKRVVGRVLRCECHPQYFQFICNRQRIGCLDFHRI